MEKNACTMKNVGSNPHGLLTMGQHAMNVSGLNAIKMDGPRLSPRGGGDTVPVNSLFSCVYQLASSYQVGLAVG